MPVPLQILGMWVKAKNFQILKKGRIVLKVFKSDFFLGLIYFPIEKLKDYDIFYQSRQTWRGVKSPRKSNSL